MVNMRFQFAVTVIAKEESCGYQRLPNQLGVLTHRKVLMQECDTHMAVTYTLTCKFCGPFTPLCTLSLTSHQRNASWFCVFVSGFSHLDFVSANNDEFDTGPGGFGIP